MCLYTNVSDEELEKRIRVIEQRIWSADVKYLPILNEIFSNLIDEQVRRDLDKKYTAPG